MRILASITAVMLFTFMLAASPGFAQEDKPDHAQEQSKKDKDKDAKGAKQDDNARPNENRRDESRPEGRDKARPENGRPQEQARPEERRNDNMGRQARPEEHGGRDQRSAEGHRGQRIPEEKFRANFGREHHFHVSRAQIVNQAQPQFIYGGYTFVLQQSWPAEWAFDDDCYIEYVDGDYYLYDVYHPEIHILVFVIG